MRFDIGDPDLWDEVDEAIDRIQEPLSLNACPDCAGINGEHGLVHTRYGNGGGGNIPCPRSMAEDPQ